MAADPRKRQKKLQRRAAKRKTKHQDMVRAKSAGLAERLDGAAGCPVLHSCATDDLSEQGLGWVCLSRQQPDGTVAFAIFLVDRYCLGVKDATADITSRYNYDTNVIRKMRSEFRSTDLSPAATRKLIEGAVEYARGLGFAPHPDYHRAMHIFGTIDPAECKEEFEFGHEGKPLFIRGPHDSSQRCRQILNTLEKSCGPGGFDYLMDVGGDLGVIEPTDIEEDVGDTMELTEEYHRDR
jgi:hypothetical protein